MKQSLLKKNKRSRNYGWIGLLVILSNGFIGTVFGFNMPGFRLQNRSVTKSYRQHSNKMRIPNSVITRSKAKKTSSMAMMILPHDMLDSVSSIINQFHVHEIPSMPMDMINSQQNVPSVENFNWEALLSTMYSNGDTIPPELAAVLDSQKSIPPLNFDGGFESVLKEPEKALEVINKGKHVIDEVDISKLDMNKMVSREEVYFSVVNEAAKSSSKVTNVVWPLVFSYFLFDFFVLSSAENELYKEDIEEFGADVRTDFMERMAIRAFFISLICIIGQFMVR